MTPQATGYERPLLPHERRVFRGPNASVVMNVRFRGKVSLEALKAAVLAIQRRHRLLNVRVETDGAGDAFFTSRGVQDAEVKAAARETDGHWMEVCRQECRVPYELDRRPAIRFVLLQGSSVSDLVIVCHHMICDALSLAYLARDLLVYLGDPARVQVLPDPPLAQPENMPSRARQGWLTRWSVGRLNKKWARERVTFDEQDYREIVRAYWETYATCILTVNLTEAQTDRLVARCREESVTVNTALLATLLAAQTQVQGNREAYLHQVATALDIRPFLLNPPGEAVGFYAGGAILAYKYPAGRAFWEVTRELHQIVRQQLKPETVLAKIEQMGLVEPSFYDALTFKRYSRLVASHQDRYEKLSAFRSRRDALARYMRARNTESLRVGLVLSNLTRLPFPRSYGELELERMMFVGAATEAYQKVVGVVTAAGKLSMTISFVEQAIDASSMERFRAAVLDLLDEYVGW